MTLSQFGIEQRVVATVCGMCEIAPGDITRESRLRDDLGLDDLGAVEFVMALENAFGAEIWCDEAEALETIGDAVDLIQHLLTSNRGPATPPASKAQPVRCTICSWRGQCIHPQPKRCPACGATVTAR